MNTWGLEIAIVASPGEGWAQAEQLLDELRSKDGRAGTLRGAFCSFEYGLTDLTAEEAIADVKRMLTEIDPDASRLLDVGLA